MGAKGFINKTGAICSPGLMKEENRFGGC